ncbi:GNAT family N-acetyltransferase [Pseudooceanicola sp.]|uniref:GNAT family N-acetyltransferase n=1 Tax=Pseudooceanicola sp. TaxID=1914328 RepID=UPI0035C77AA5
MYGVPGQISFRRVVEDDLPLLHGWMKRPHWREWWGDPDEELSYVRDMVEGRDSTEPYFFLLDGVPGGYIQMWRIADARYEPWLTEAPWLTALPDHAIGVDLSIADAADLSLGLGTAVLNRFVADLRARGFDHIIIDPDPANTRAVRAYSKAGFRPVPDLEGRTGDSLIMRHAETIQ